MSKPVGHVNRRRFLQTAVQASAVFAAPLVLPGSVLGKDGAVCTQRTDRAGRHRQSAAEAPTC